MISAKFAKTLAKSRLVTTPWSVIATLKYSSFVDWVPGLYKEYWKRRKENPPPLRHRNTLVNWNYNSEIFAFGKRLGEEFNEDMLKIALTHKSYLDAEANKRADLGIASEDTQLLLKDNSELADQGKDLVSRYVKGFIRYSYPYFPEEGVCSIHDFLTTDEMLAHIAKNIGLSDIILSGDFPPTNATLAKSVFAIIGALLNDQGEKRARLFVLDFVITQLIGQDINYLFTILNPMGILTQILERDKRGPPEPRLLRQSGCTTVEAFYYVGIYSNKVLIGQAPGETIFIAEEMAARDALKRLFGTTENAQAMKFGKEGRKIDLSSWITTENPSIHKWSSEYFSKGEKLSQ